MKSYKNVFLSAAMTILLLTGCADSKYTSIEINGNEASAKSVNLTAAVPDDWELFRGEELYRTIYAEVSDYYDSADKMREENEENGLRYVLYMRSKSSSAESSPSVIVKTLSMSSLDGMTASEYSRDCHDTEVIGYQSTGLSVSGGSYEEHEYGGLRGWLSEYAVSGEDGFIIGSVTFMYQHEDKLVIVSGNYYSDEERESIENAFGSIKQAEQT